MLAKCYIYWNLHKKCYSVKYRGKVIQQCYRLYSQQSSLLRGRILMNEKLMSERLMNQESY